MRESIGGIWITQLVIAFMLIFVAFLALSLNYTKAFKIKNELLTIIEKREGITTGDDSTISIINNYLRSNNYNVTKTCELGSYGVADLNKNTIDYVTNNKKYYYCITKIKSLTNPDKVNYKVNVFFYFNLPVIGDIFKFNISGSTGNIAVPVDKLIYKEE